VNVLLEDPELLAVHKPSGVVVIPARDEDPAASLHHTLQRARGERLWVVHRIDRETSGVVLFARTASAHQRLNDLFATRAVEKRYVAFTAGAALPDDTTVTLALHAARKGKMRPAREGEADAVDAVTGVQTVSRWKLGGVCVSRVLASPRTGRQHQIRVHLRALGAPIVGDALYGKGIDAQVPRCARLALHAWEVMFPWRGGTVTVRAELPDDLADYARALG
jgi:RluA family pseudouridine synthase